MQFTLSAVKANNNNDEQYATTAHTIKTKCL